MGALMIAFCSLFWRARQADVLGEKSGLARKVRHALIVVDDCHAAGSVAAVEVSRSYLLELVGDPWSPPHARSSNRRLLAHGLLKSDYRLERQQRHLAALDHLTVHFSIRTMTEASSKPMLS
jgi:hypothetical protein